MNEYPSHLLTKSFHKHFSSIPTDKELPQHLHIAGPAEQFCSHNLLTSTHSTLSTSKTFQAFITAVSAVRTHL